jgi:hypothetical protein
MYYMRSRAYLVKYMGGDVALFLLREHASAAAYQQLSCSDRSVGMCALEGNNFNTAIAYNNGPCHVTLHGHMTRANTFFAPL